MARETQHVWHNHRLAFLRRGTAHAAPEADLLAGGAALEWAQQQDIGVAAWCVLGRAECGEFILADVEACPVYGGRGGREGGVGVPEEGGDIGEVAVFISGPRSYVLGLVGTGVIT
jgi:hypothetical protein